MWKVVLTVVTAPPHAVFLTLDSWQCQRQEHLRSRGFRCRADHSVSGHVGSGFSRPGVLFLTLIQSTSAGLVTDRVTYAGCLPGSFNGTNACGRRGKKTQCCEVRCAVGLL